MSEISIVKTAKTGKIAKRIESKKHELKVVVVKD